MIKHNNDIRKKSREDAYKAEKIFSALLLFERC